MTVGELIEELQRWPKWTPVRLRAHEMVEDEEFGAHPPICVTANATASRATWQGNHVLIQSE